MINSHLKGKSKSLAITSTFRLAATSVSGNHTMVQFHEHVISELLDEPSGGIGILSSVLSFSQLICSLLLLHEPSQGSLLILSPSSQSLRSQISHHLQSSDESPEVAEITAELPAHHRLPLYSSGQTCFITTRILIVDLLTRKIPVTSLAGLILPNAHSLSETSTEAFIVRIVKSLSRSVYVRAFTDKPHAMVSGFAKTERIMKVLYIRKLHLWPRFQVYVSEELERSPPEVVDVRVPMSKYMVGIQKLIVEVMDACLKEMRKTNKVDVEDLTVENGLFKSFDEIVRRQLDPIWHTLGKKTNQLVSDLKTLRKLLDYLVSIWIRLGCQRFFALSGYLQSRAIRYLIMQRNDTSSVSEGVVLEEVLAEAPKWKVLRVRALRNHNGDHNDPEGLEEGAKKIPPLYFYALERDEPILDMLKPSVIIVYHPDMTFVREIQVFKAENLSKKVKVYFIFYEASIELHKFEDNIRIENGAFESLIRQKSMMMIPVDQNLNCLGLNSSDELEASSSQNSITRKAGGGKMSIRKCRVFTGQELIFSEIFATLKVNQDEPELDKVVRVCVPSEEGIVESDVRDENYNTSAVEFLRRLPGVNDSYYRLIMDRCKSLAELALLPAEKLAELVGG
ncbi:unnamed protein product [Linum tenue]|uniref:DNA repair endonuclease UVH1 n=1 Tax=Linum tenue TaxID=586396 RepID=A0AAV0Q5H7_9ROSI|nr:unnamed protein product [Linum tenue]